MEQQKPRTITKGLTQKPSYSPRTTSHGGRRLRPNDAPKSRPSPLVIFTMIKCVGEAWCQKTLAFLSSHTSQETSITKEAVAFLEFASTHHHHPRILCGGFNRPTKRYRYHVDRPKVGLNSKCKEIFDIWIKRHDEDSWTWIHRGEFPQSGQPPQLQRICRSNYILQDQPSKELVFRRCPKFSK
jgi:hypothetical protein